jgi:hypothetical protein
MIYKSYDISGLELRIEKLYIILYFGLLCNLLIYHLVFYKAKIKNNSLINSLFFI